ncbi:MAG TPA: EscU/YscU/HrcU family type III secretion system export apparatus switch protein [Bacillota bacterium]|jgi:flagellar biosynthesis protein|nr:hypothetical protein [Bacillota bacterium]HOB87183.1 EscU/YscU/HrcU family type III secretion system export apparatus switch protein [Bacillota bacterium]HOP69320.1 EscU/YscU/HrcU family type III secretion system export apparatus switch protein [Bacillota bacterium]HPT34728.1 EscU/YscU/HrcU family type III secretion system export apparatus switch protein [Bacillota bacterium]HPZ65424.1 EscU/YscU/HrcU family type III secretion system export apparatus switch protein [Bacillota bacterium]
MAEQREDKGAAWRRAVALRYRQGQDRAPVVVASGRGWLAEKIIALARESNIPVYDHQPLAEILQSLNPGEEIPVELYEAVAAVYAFILDVDSRLKQK